MLSWLCGTAKGAEAVGPHVAITAGFDSATTVLLIVLVFLVALVAVLIGSLYLTGRVSKAKDEVVSKLEDEAQELKQFHTMVISRIVEAQGLQSARDVFQTIAQGSRPLGH